MDTLRDELDEMAVDQVWELVNFSCDRKSIGSKWVLKVKLMTHGSTDKYFVERLYIERI